MSSLQSFPPLSLGAPIISTQLWWGKTGNLPAEVKEQSHIRIPWIIHKSLFEGCCVSTCVWKEPGNPSETTQLCYICGLKAEGWGFKKTRKQPLVSTGSCCGGLVCGSTAPPSGDNKAQHSHGGIFLFYFKYTSSIYIKSMRNFPLAYTLAAHTQQPATYSFFTMKGHREAYSVQIQYLKNISGV